ncbi:MAG TPA: hypothetical protein VI230_01490 [Ignavibacteriaceae bacterium]
MEFNPKKIDRKKFFSSLGTAAFGYFLIKSLPFGLMKNRTDYKRVSIEINPDAISRTKIGEKNG